MLRINRLRVEINTVKGVYGIDKTFEDGLNFIASLENTCGKSSILAAIYYCLCRALTELIFPLIHHFYPLLMVLT